MPDNGLTIRDAKFSDQEAVREIDVRNTGLAKPDYWRDIFQRFVGRAGRHILVAETAQGAIAGFIIGEVRAWEFGSQPCGWVVGIGVPPEARQQRIGRALFDEICRRLWNDGVETIRTMIAREDRLNMSFFRAQGMMAGPFIELEMPLSRAEAVASTGAGS